MAAMAAESVGLFVVWVELAHVVLDFTCDCSKDRGVDTTLRGMLPKIWTWSTSLHFFATSQSR